MGIGIFMLPGFSLRSVLLARMILVGVVNTAGLLIAILEYRKTTK